MIKELEVYIKKNGFDYRLYDKTDNGYIYEQIMNGKTISYEVFQRKINTKFNCVSFPSGNAFGIWAWTFWDEKGAINKLKSFT